MDFKKVILLIKNEFKKNNIDFALIGGLAVSIYTEPRITRDLDFMIFLKDYNKAKDLLEQNSYKLEFKSNDIATFISEKQDLGRIDFLFAHREKATEMLNNAIKYEVFPEVYINILKPEDIIGLKVQAFNNNPKRYYKDMADIEKLMRCSSCADFDKIKSYFKLFKREKEYKELQEKLQNEKE